MRLTAMRRERTLGLVSAFCCAMLLARSGLGDDNGAAAQSLFDQGKQLMSEGKVAEACLRFQESQRLDPAGGTLLLLATCHEKEGKTATAWLEFNEALSASRRDARPDREKRAAESIEALRGKLSTITVVVSQPAPAKLQVRRDGQDVGPLQWSVPIAADPGPHTISASAPGKQRWQTTVNLAGDAAKLTISIPQLLDGGAPELGDAPSSDTSAGQKMAATGPSSEAKSRPIAGAVTAGAGVIITGVGIGLAVAAKSHYDESAPFCNGDKCYQQGFDIRSDARDRAGVATVVSGVGLAAMVGGGLWWLFGGAPAKSTTVGFTGNEVIVSRPW